MKHRTGLPVTGPIQAHDGAVLVDVDVTPSADRDAFPAGYNEWRERVEARVRAPAEDGEANRALCEIVARALDVDAGRVGVKSGHKSRRKRLIVEGCSTAEVERALGGVLDA